MLFYLIYMHFGKLENSRHILGDDEVRCFGHFSTQIWDPAQEDNLTTL